MVHVKNCPYGNRGNPSTEFYTEGRPQIYCYGWIDPRNDEPIEVCKLCADHVDKAQDDLTALLALKDQHGCHYQSREKEQTMSRYIEEVALIADLDKGLWGNDYDKALAEAIIDSAPSIDIVRCRDCIHWRTHSSAIVEYDEYGECRECRMMNDRSTYDSDYCSYGERKEQ